MTVRVGSLEVPVVWSPSDLTGPDSDGHAGRLGHAIAAIVHHRVVGSLESMVNSTFKPTTDDVLVAGERRVSSHFGIGFWGTELRIYQFIALEDTAYCNGQSASDKAACTWALWHALGKPPANEITVSIEHEDNAAAGEYVVVEPIIAASIALDRLLLTGDGPAIRAAGIRCSDAAAAQLAAIQPSTETLVDHHVVAPVSKPYCWTKYGADPGFPQARYIAELSAALEEDDVQITEVNAEDWVPAGGERRPVRATPNRGAGVIVGYIELGEIVRTILEAKTPDGNVWRLTERSQDPGWLLRSDFIPLVQGGDPALHAQFDAFMARTPAVDCAPLVNTARQEGVAAGLRDGARAVKDAAVNEAAKYGG